MHSASDDVGTSEGLIWSRLLVPIGTRLTLNRARQILQLEFSQTDQDRMHTLALKAQEGTLTVDELKESRAYERVGSILASLKSAARRRLKSPS